MMPVAFNKGVHPGSVSVQNTPAMLCQVFYLGSGSAVHAQAAAEAICLQGDLAENFAEPARANAPVELHLPETLSRMCVALGEVQVIFVLGINMGHTITVGDDLDNLVQSLQV